MGNGGSKGSEFEVQAEGVLWVTLLESCEMHNAQGNTRTETPAWPHRPPLGATLGVLGSVILGAAFCWANARLLDAPKRALLPTYLESRVRILVPTFGQTRSAGHAFVLPDHSKITMPPALMYATLRKRTFDGKSILALFVPAGIAFMIAFIALLVIGAKWDRRYVANSRSGRLIRGPRVVTPDEYARATKGDGLRFEVE